MLLERGADPVGGPGDQNSGRCPFVAAVLKPHPNQIQNLQVPQLSMAWKGLGSGNSHMFFNFHPDFCGEMIQFDYFFQRGVGSTT